MKITDRLSLIVVVYALILFACAAPVASRASDSLSLTITPPFFQLNVSPGDAWSSSIKVVNTNASVLTVYASVAGFAAADDLGHGKFLDLASIAGDRDALANWITASSGPVTIPPGGTGEIPFSIAVPGDASPGGHYAAILIGTAPPASSSGASGSHIGVSSYISSLIFARVSGDINEAGDIQEFSTPNGFYQSPDVSFTLKFANTGNVHLRPVGEIEIYNAWGKERGKIDVNQSGSFGYVLPSSTREFDYEWRGDVSWFDIGPYTAVATIAYGENGSKSVSRTISFWILPVWRLLMVAGGTLFFIIIFVIAIRRYVRRALSIEMSKFGTAPSPRLSAPPMAPAAKVEERPHFNMRALREPVVEGVVDLRRAYKEAIIKEQGGKVGFDWSKYLRSLRRYAVAGILFLLVLLGILWISLYIKALWGNSPGYEIKANNPGQPSQWVKGASGQ